MPARVYAVANQKGGVSKTTTTRNVGAALARRGRKVLLVDFDPQGHLTLSFGLNPNDIQRTTFYALMQKQVSFSSIIMHHNTGVDLAPTNLHLSGAEIELQKDKQNGNYYLRNKLTPLLNAYDYILIDCPPSLGQLTMNALTAATGVFIPVQCQFLAYHGLVMLLNTVRAVQQKPNPHLQIVGILPTLYDVRTMHCREVLTELRKNYAPYLIDIPIPYRTGLADAMTGGESIFEYDPSSDVAMLYTKIAEVLDAKR